MSLRHYLILDAVIRLIASIGPIWRLEMFDAAAFAAFNPLALGQCRRDRNRPSRDLYGGRNVSMVGSHSGVCRAQTNGLRNEAQAGVDARPNGAATGLRRARRPFAIHLKPADRRGRA